MFINHINIEEIMIKLFECFSGYGGASFALKKSGIEFECVGNSEIDETVNKLYEQNFPNVTNYGDITKIDPTKLPDFDLMTGGFPCQDISIQGNTDLSKGRSILIFDMLRIAKAKMPKYILLENVRNILSDKFKPFLDSILTNLDLIGYDVFYKSMNSKDYGMPQNRPRVFFVCIRKDLHETYEFPQKEKLTISVKDLLESDVGPEYLCKNNFKTWTKYVDTDCLKRRLLKGFSTIDSDVAHCFTTRMFNSMSGNFVSTTQDENLKHYDLRMMTPNECFKVMGFDDGMINLDNFSKYDLYKICGNGWDINLVSKIFSTLFDGKNDQ